MQRARKLSGDNLKLVWAEFSTISWAVLKMCMKLMYVDAQPSLWLKTRPRFRPVSKSLPISDDTKAMEKVNIAVTYSAAL
jgi:hypothetical protein